MAEFCLECLNKLNGTSDSENKYILSKDLDLCECCGKWKKIVVMEHRTSYLDRTGLFAFLWNQLKR